jgi:hypothetical protein
VEITEENLATTILVAKYYPYMTMEDIQLKLARGDIGNPLLKHKIQRIQDRKDKIPNESTFVKFTPKPKISRNTNGATYNYFSSIMDLNKKIVSGQLIRKIIHTGDPLKDMTERSIYRTDELETFSESIRPCFVSSRKSKPVKTRASEVLEPPLVPKVCQDSEPFFVADESILAPEDRQ